ncbi:hypothetical protein JVX93_12585 [Mycolicibacterium boenickei]|nr:hypothetical protein JVX93_12585 [Mycolicibacterium boenickei]
MAVIRGTALTNFHQLVAELGGDSRSRKRWFGTTPTAYLNTRIASPPQP